MSLGALLPKPLYTPAKQLRQKDIDVGCFINLRGSGWGGKIAAGKVGLDSNPGQKTAVDW